MRRFDNEIADVFAMLHPATLPMLKLMFEDFRRNAEDDGGDAELMALADRAAAAVSLLLE